MEDLERDDPARRPQRYSNPLEDDFFTPFPAVPWVVPKEWPLPSAPMTAWAPRVHVVDRGDALVIRAEVPGMRAEEIKVSVARDRVTIQGERHRDRAVRGETYYRRECSYGRFHRELALPVPVEPEAASMDYESGVLTLVLPKAPRRP